LLHMGYTYDEEELDSEWIQSLAVEDPTEFQELTGYRVPTQVLCRTCGECTPDVHEMIVGGEDGEVYTRTMIRCTNDGTTVMIRAMSEAAEPMRAYRSSMRRPVVNSIYCSITVNHRLTGPGKMVELCLLFVGKFQIQKFD
jgi:hypothetical protein